MTFDLRAVSSGVTRMEYRIGNDSWSEVDMDSLQIQIPSPEANSTLRLNLYGKKKKPIATYDYWYNGALGTWVQGVPTTETVVSASSSKTEVVAPPAKAAEPVSIPAATVAASESMTFDLRSVSSEVTRIEYRLGDGSWSDMNMNSLQIQLPRPKAESTLQLNLYGKKKKPIATYDYRYDVALGTWIHGDQAAVRAAAAEAVVPVSSVKEEVAAIAKAPVEVPVPSTATAEPASSTETVVPATPSKEEVVVAPPAETVEPVSIPEATVAASKSMTFDLRAVSSGVTRMEYRLGNEPWCDVDMDCLQIQIPSPEADSTLSLNLYGKKKKPIATYDYRYDVALGTWIHGDQATVRAAATEAVVPASSVKEEAVAIAKAPVEVPVTSTATAEPASSTETVVPATPIKEEVVVAFATAPDVPVTPIGAEVAAPPVETVEPVSIPAATVAASKSMTFDLRAVSSGVTRMEYRLGNEPWCDVDMDCLQIQIPSPEADSTLSLNLYGKKKKKPIATYDYRYDVALGTWIHGDQATVRAAATEAVVPVSTAAVAESVPQAEKELVASPESVVPTSSVEATMSEASNVSVEAASSQDAAPMPPDFWILDLNAFDSEVVRIEYRFSGEESWRDVDMESLLIPLPDPDTETNLQLRMHVKNKRSVM